MLYLFCPTLNIRQIKEVIRINKRIGLMVARTRKGMSITKLAKLSGITRTYCSLIENGRYEPLPDVWVRLAKVLNVSVKELRS